MNHQIKSGRLGNRATFAPHLDPSQRRYQTSENFTDAFDVFSPALVHAIFICFLSSFDPERAETTKLVQRIYDLNPHAGFEMNGVYLNHSTEMFLFHHGMYEYH